MKLSKFGRIALASVVSLGLGFGATACGPSNTIDFLYVTASKQNPGQISVYKVDSEAGILYQITDSPYGSGGRNPVADVASPNGKNLYVINHDDNTIVEFAIGTDGKLYPQQTCNLPGSYPIAADGQPGRYLSLRSGDVPAELQHQHSRAWRAGSLSHQCQWSAGRDEQLVPACARWHKRFLPVGE